MNAAVSLFVLPEPVEIVLKKHPDRTVGYACADCGAMYTTVTFGGGPDGLLAAHHAAQAHCHHYCSCGQPVVIGRTRCDDCWRTVVGDKEQKVFKAAVKVTIEEYDDQPVYWESIPGGSSMTGDGYYLNIEEFLDRCEEEEMDVPEYIWATKPVSLTLDAEYLLENALTEHAEDTRDSISTDAELELQALLDGWCDKQKVKSWEPDYKKAIVLHPKD